MSESIPPVMRRDLLALIAQPMPGEPEPMSPERLAEIAAREEAATPGPWQFDHADREVMTGHGIGVAEAHLTDDDGRFIAHARADVPALLAEVERRGAELAKYAAEPTVAEEMAYLGRCIDAVLDLCDGAEQGAARWEQPLPVPEWVAPVRAAATGERGGNTVVARPTRADVLREAVEVVDTALSAEPNHMRASALYEVLLKLAALQPHTCGRSSGLHSQDCPSYVPGHELVSRVNGLKAYRRERGHTEAPFVAGPATDAGYPPAMPWAAWLDDEDLGGFLLDLAGAAIDYYRPGTANTETLASIERAIATWRLIAEADHAQATAPGPDTTEVAHVVTDASDDPEYADDCPGCPVTTEAGEGRG